MEDRLRKWNELQHYYLNFINFFNSINFISLIDARFEQKTAMTIAETVMANFFDLCYQFSSNCFTGLGAGSIPIQRAPGINASTLAVSQHDKNVHRAMAGMASTVGNAMSNLNIPTHTPSQNMCMRYMAKLRRDRSATGAGVVLRSMQLNSRNAPMVST